MMYDKIKENLEKEAFLYRDKKGNEYYMKNSDRLVVIVCVIIFILGIIIDAKYLRIIMNSQRFQHLYFLQYFGLVLQMGLARKKVLKVDFIGDFFYLL